MKEFAKTVGAVLVALALVAGARLAVNKFAPSQAV